jgi:PAS domain S-box-containing protein
MSDYRLSDFLDLTILQKMADAHYRAAGMPIGIIDARDGSVLVGSGWQDICVKFHRANKVSLQRCRESGDYIKNCLVEGEACRYRCKNGLWDIGVPIMVAGRHLATMFLGQFFYEEEAPDRELFVRQAHELGFDIDDYLAALDRVPVFSRQKVAYILEYNKALASFIADIAEQSVLKIRADRTIRESERKFHALFDHAHQLLGLLSADGMLLDANITALEFAGAEKADVVGKPFWETPWWTHSPELQEEVRLAVKKAAEGEFVRFEATHPAADGNIRYIDFSLKPVIDETGKVVLLIPEGRDITEHKRAESEIRRQAEFLQVIIDTIPNPVFFKDRVGRYIGCNRAFEQLYGMPRDRIAGKTVYDLAPKELADLYSKTDDDLFAHPGTQIYEGRFQSADGALRDMTFHKAIFEGPDGEPAGLVGALVDITERKRADAALMASEEKYRMLVQNANSIILRRDISGKVTFFNEFAQRFFGYSEEEIIGRNVVGTIVPEVESTGRNLKAMIEDIGKNPDRYINNINENMLRNGERVWVAWTNKPIRDNKGRVAEVLCIGNDFTERKRTEEALRESDARFRTLVEGAPEAIFVHSQGRFLYLNPGMVSLLGASKSEDLLDSDSLAVVAPEYREAVRRRIDLQIETGKALPLLEMEFLRLDGSRVSVETTSVPITFQGRPARLVFVRDISDRKRSQQVLREREEIYAAIVDQAAEGIVLVDTETLRFVEFNDAACNGLGYSREEFANLTLFDLQANLSRQEVTERIQTLLRKGQGNFENRHRRKDGTSRDALISNRAINFRGRTCLVAIWQDITERKRSEAEQARVEARFREAQKLEAIGTLAGGIAHDFNNILTPIIGYTELALRDTPHDNPARHGLEQVLNAAMRAKVLIGQILAFGRSSGEQQKVPAEISSIVNEALNLLRASLPSSIEIRHGIEKGVALADATQIHQVLINLCTNAAHAMDEKGIMEVHLSYVKLRKSDLADHLILGVKPGPYLKLSVSDTGCGMDAATLERIFDPYFTTKEVGKGSGLGLSVVNGIVKRHDGAITVRSVPGKGSTFSVYIPAIGTVSGDTVETRQVMPTGTERILLIDDEQIIAEMGTAILEQLGYQVTSETKSPRALEIFRSKSDEFDLVITDYTMPKLTGLELSREIHRIRPDIPIILCTGYTEKLEADDAKDLGVELIMKPFSMKQIAELVRKALRA